MRRFGVPLVPLALSLLLSGASVGSTVAWQDSGFYLVAVKELGVLYPPGFVLYLVLCKTWTLLFGFLDFTLAVHLFSSACAALAAAAVALAARDLLRSEGPLFKLGLGANDLAAMAAGCLAAAGYTFWSAAILAKGYALLYLILALLIWRMIRADATGAPRDFTIVAVLIGLAWAAHPSAASLGPALAAFVVACRGRLGGKSIAARSGLAAAVAIGPSLLLPLLAARNPLLQFGSQDSFREWFLYFIGARFTLLRGVFGVDSFRVVNALRFLWEDFLGVGLALALLGLARVARSNRRLFLGILTWVVPAAALATLFRIEGQQDLWLVSAWLPLHLAVAVGLAALPAPAARWALPVLGVAGLTWAIGANYRDVSMRGYTLAETFGRVHLEGLERDAILIVYSDDALATTMYLQIVKGLRPDVTILCSTHIEFPHTARRLAASAPGIKLPSPMTLRGFAEANAASRPVYVEVAMPDSPDSLTPAGPLLRYKDPDPTPKSWDPPFTPEDLRTRFRRERGLRMTMFPDHFVLTPERYEQRWINLIVRSRAAEARAWFKKGGDDALRKSAQRYEEVRAAEPDRQDQEVLHGLGVDYYLLKEFERAEPLLRQVLEMNPTPRQAVRCCTFLSLICRAQGRAAEAARLQERAMTIVGSDPALRREFEQFPRPR
jgi:tetratricopeptide (TPR) repeat protein